jgi:uncharacterized protein YjiS (DUF1127 family)
MTRCLREHLCHREYVLLIFKKRAGQKRRLETVMSIISTQPASSQAFAGNSCTFRLAATLKRWSAVYLNWRLRQAAIAELAVLSDRELKDMGLTRGEIEGSVTNASKCEHAFNR